MWRSRRSRRRSEERRWAQLRRAARAEGLHETVLLDLDRSVLDALGATREDVGVELAVTGSRSVDGVDVRVTVAAVSVLAPGRRLGRRGDPRTELVAFAELPAAPVAATHRDHERGPFVRNERSRTLGRLRVRPVVLRSAVVGIVTAPSDHTDEAHIRSMIADTVRRSVKP